MIRVQPISQWRMPIPYSCMFLPYIYSSIAIKFIDSSILPYLPTLLSPIGETSGDERRQQKADPPSQRPFPLSKSFPCSDLPGPFLHCYPLSWVILMTEIETDQPYKLIPPCLRP